MSSVYPRKGRGSVDSCAAGRARTRGASPLLRDPATAAALDAPAYRARRILLPAAAFLFGLGQPRFVVQAYAIQNAVCWLALALLLRWFPPRNAENVWRAAGCLFAFGSSRSRSAATTSPSR